MDAYWETACEIEATVDNAIRRCFDLGESDRSIRHAIDHIFYIRGELDRQCDELRHLGPVSYGIERSADLCRITIHEYCVVIQEISEMAILPRAVERYHAEILEGRELLGSQHALLSEAMDEYEDRQHTRASIAPAPGPPLRSTHAIPIFDDGTLVINSHTTRRRLAPRGPPLGFQGYSRPDGHDRLRAIGPSGGPYAPSNGYIAPGQLSGYHANRPPPAESYGDQNVHRPFHDYPSGSYAGPVDETRIYEYTHIRRY